jgi:lipid A 3-O-deacylase
MKAVCIILVSLLFFTACHRQQVKQPAKIQHAPLVIDYPAGVMISPQRKAHTAYRNLTFAEKILSPHQIPVLDSNTRQMVFIKMNGDRVILGMDELAGKYDIILFNTVNNPVPLRIADLQGAFNDIFNFGGVTKIQSEIPRFRQKHYAQVADTAIPGPVRRSLSGLRNRDKRIIVTIADTSSRKFVARIIPGVQWVEQRVDTRSILKVNFENDLITYANTDRYFTNGITIDLQAAWLHNSAFQKLMIPYRHKALVTYNLSMVQDMYTPTDTRVAPTLAHDRPYASYLYFGFRRTVADPMRLLKITTEIDAGYMGPYSPGSYLQTLVHKTFPTNDVPQGWETQINTDVILNYNVKVQKALVNHRKFTLLAELNSKTGTLYNNAGAGLQLQAGRYEPVFGLSGNEQWPKTECYFFARTNVSFVAYNALLQGGVFDHHNVFTLKGNEIERWVGAAEAGLHMRYKGIGIELAQHYLSPEYKGGLWHKWGRVSLLFKL